MALNKNVALVIITVAVLAGAAVFVAANASLTPRAPTGEAQSTPSSFSGLGPGMMSSYTTTTGSMMQTSYQPNSTWIMRSSMMRSGAYRPTGTLYIQDAIQQMKTIPPYAKVVRQNNTIIFSSHAINLTVLSMGGDRARNLTGMQLPAYSTDNVFVIYGLINPALVVPKGALLHVLVANLDEDTYHNYVIGTFGPPYPHTVTPTVMTGQGSSMGSGMMGGGYGGFLYMMPALAPANYNGGWAPVYSYAVTIPNSPGLWYLCTYAGHAQSGMYGQILVAS